MVSLLNVSHSERYVFIEALIYISLVTHDAEHLMCSFVIGVSSLVKCQFKSFPILKTFYF